MKLLLVVISFLLLNISNNSFAQNIGIGTTPVRAKLELHGSILSTSGIFGGESTGISLQSNWPGIGFNEYAANGFRYIANGYGAVQYLNPGNGYMTFAMLPNGLKDAAASTLNTAMVISNTGNIGIRTNPANASLYTIKGNNFDGAAVFAGWIYSSNFCYGTEEHTYIRPGFSNRYVYLNDVGGNVVFGGGNNTVGINAPDPTYTLEIRQNSSRGLLIINPNDQFNNWEERVEYFSGGPASILGFRYNGSFIMGVNPNDGHLGGISDRRVKTNIHPLGQVLDKLMLLKPSVYEMKDHNDGHEKTFGFIAQEVKPLFPDLVTVKQIKVNSFNRIADLHGLSYSRFSVIAIKALQEQYAQIKALEKENAELMGRLERLTETISTGVPAQKR